MKTEVDVLPSGEVAVRFIEQELGDARYGSRYTAPLSPDLARDLALALLRATMTAVQRDALSNSLDSWWSQCSDYGTGSAEPDETVAGYVDDDGTSFDEQLTAVEGLQVALGLREAM